MFRKNALKSDRTVLTQVSILVMLDVILFLILFDWLLPFPGFVAFGDLPSQYLYLPINLNNVNSLTLYPLFSQLIAQISGPVFAQNFVFLASLFFPSIGILLFLREFSDDTLFLIVVSVGLGTIISPLLSAEFLGGGFEYFSWLFFLFLSLKYLKRYTESKGIGKDLILSAVYYGFSISSTGFFPDGLYLSAPFIISLLIGHNKMRLKLRTRAIGLLLFIALSFIMNLLLFLHSILYNLPYFTSAYAKSQAAGYVYGTMRFEFPPYSSGIGFFGGVWAGPSFGFLSGSLYYLFSVLCVLGGIFSFLFRNRLSWIVHRFFIIYLLAGLIIYILTFPLADAFYLKIKIFDSLEYPSFFILMEYISASVLIVNFGAVFGFVVERGMYSLSRGSWNSAFAERIKAFLIRKGYKSSNRKVSGLIVSTIVLVLLVGGNFGFLSSVQGDFTTAQGDAFIPSGMLLTHNWYLSEEPNISGKILILPSYSQYYLNAAEAGLPQKVIFNQIQNGAPIPGYNYSLLDEIYSLPATNDSFVYANDLADLGIQFVILYNFTGTGQLSNNGTGLSHSELRNFLESSIVFNETYGNVWFQVYKNELYNAGNAHYTFLLEPSDLSNYRSMTDVLNVSRYSPYLGINVSTDPKDPFTSLSFSLFYNNGLLNYQNKDLPSQDPSLFVSYQLKLNITYNKNGSVYAYVYYYNSTNPRSFYTQFYSESLFSSVTNNTRLLESELNIPSGTKMARIIIYDAPTSKTNFTTKIGNISLMQQIVVNNISSNLKYQQFIMDLLYKSHSFGIPFNFISPAFQSVILKIAINRTLYAGSALPHTSNNSFHLNFGGLPKSQSPPTELFLIWLGKNPPVFGAGSGVEFTNYFAGNEMYVTMFNGFSGPTKSVSLSYKNTYYPISYIVED